MKDNVKLIEFLVCIPIGLVLTIILIKFCFGAVGLLANRLSEEVQPSQVEYYEKLDEILK